MQICLLKDIRKFQLGPKEWSDIKTKDSSLYEWRDESTYVKKPPFFENMSEKPEGFIEIKNARPLINTW